MQTFLPSADFAESARLLDDKRLGKQRVETLQIMRATHVPNYGWRSHPAVLMWKGYEEALAAYGLAMCTEWTDRGFNDTCCAKIRDEFTLITGRRRVRTQAKLAALSLLPAWLGDEALHASHQSALVRKDPAFYRERFGDVPVDLDYVWPVRSAEAIARAERAARRAGSQ